MDDRDNTRSFSKTYTINAANTWEHKSVTFAGDTTGALDDDNANSFHLSWWLVAGVHLLEAPLPQVGKAEPMAIEFLHQM